MRRNGDLHAAGPQASLVFPQMAVVSAEMAGEDASAAAVGGTLGCTSAGDSDTFLALDSRNSGGGH